LLSKINLKAKKKWKESKKILHRAVCTIVGLEISIYKKDYHYVPDYYGRSAKKQIDIRTLEPFGALAKSVISQGQCLLYYDHLYTIFQGLHQTMALSSNEGELSTAEVGVYKGGTSYFIASVLKSSNSTSVEHHCFDTFEGHAKQDINVFIETRHHAGKFDGTSYEAVQAYLKDFDNVKLYKGRFQDTCGNIRGKMFRFIHLDVDIYEPTIFALHFFDKVLIRGGIIVIDDYGFKTCPGIIKAVQEFADVNKNYAIFKLLSGQCLLVKHNEHS
jgi:hypothetical protein